MLTLSHGNAAVDDACQQTFVRAFNKLPDFDFDGSAKLSTWLRKIALRVALNHRRRSTVAMPLHTEPAHSHDGCEGKVFQMELLAAVNELPSEQRDILHLRFWEELEYHEIASILKVKVGTVKSRLSRARKELRRRFDPQAPSAIMLTRCCRIKGTNHRAPV